MRVLIVDDEPVARRGVRTILERETDAAVIGEAEGGSRAVELIRELGPDIVFLDIRMPEVDGFQVVEAVGVDMMPVTVFVTAFDEFALKAFDAHAIDYVLKPVDPDRLCDAYQRAVAQVAGVRGETGADRIAQAILTISDQRQASGRLVVRDGGRIFFVGIREIELIETDGNYVRLTVGEAVHYHREPLKTLLKRLPECFCQISRTTVVNLDFVVSLRPKAKGSFYVLLSNGREVSSSRRYRDHLSRVIG